jgi:hypothetical protein
MCRFWIRIGKSDETDRCGYTVRMCSGFNIIPSPCQRRFVERPVIDYGKAIRDVRMKLNEIYGTLKQVRLNTKNIMDMSVKSQALENGSMTCSSPIMPI